MYFEIYICCDKNVNTHNIILRGDFEKTLLYFSLTEREQNVMKYIGYDILK